MRGSIIEQRRQEIPSSVTEDEVTVLLLCDHTFKVEYIVGAFTYFCIQQYRNRILLLLIPTIITRQSGHNSDDNCTNFNYPYNCDSIITDSVEIE
ncbi:hypothetical protein TcasGA2_TC001778 [Tribolium castaneum]|uniref:Uncharacterized protein n=1 Tax=Tribolium castaneum TaxID=7070 RepID=D6W8F7_TRICA|nr:hypothetical protein TcasGA2_TC001778 [Tribolium castaneum]